MNAPRVGPRTLAYQNPYQRVDRVRVEFDGFSKEYFVNEYGARTGLVLLDAGNVLLVRQYRFLIDRIAWEIPGGRIDDGESPDQAVVRELREETGILCHHPRPLLFFHPGLDTFHNPSHLFVAHQHERVAPFTPDPREVTELAWIPLRECLQMIFRGQILDSLSISGLFAYQLVADHPGLAIAPTSTANP